MTVNINNYDINTANLPATLPPPNEWMAEFNMTDEKSRKAILSVRLYLNILRDGNMAALG
jgi:hypothetical protein